MSKELLRKMFRKFRRSISSEILGKMNQICENIDKTKSLLGKQMAIGLARLDGVSTLSEAQFSVYSQYGEDGIIEWLLQKLPISLHRFIEFGVEDYTESNTRFLLQNRNWIGLVMDCSSEHVKRIQNDDMYWKYDLTAICKFVTRENINSIME